MRRSWSARTSIGAAAAAALLVVGSTTPAAAAIHTGGYVTLTSDIVVGQNSQGGGSLKCPTGYVVVSGGAFWYIPTVELSNTLAKERTLAASLPIKGGSGWFAAGRNFGAALNLEIVIHCLPASAIGPYIIRTRTLVANPKADGTRTCPAGNRAVIGGAAWREGGEPLGPTLPRHGFLSATEMTANGRGWYAGGIRNSDSQARLRVVVMCRPDAAVGAYSRVTVDKTTGKVRGGYVSCAVGSRVVGGGASWRRPSGAPIREASVASSTPNTNQSGWYASGRLRLAQGSYLMRIRAMCRPL